jgi:hypothetical protein
MPRIVRDKLAVVKKKLGVTPIESWDAAIRQAKWQLKLARKRVTGLESAIYNWTRLKKSGMPWPARKTKNLS